MTLQILSQNGPRFSMTLCPIVIQSPGLPFHTIFTIFAPGSDLPLQAEPRRESLVSRQSVPPVPCFEIVYPALVVGACLLDDGIKQLLDRDAHEPVVAY